MKTIHTIVFSVFQYTFIPFIFCMVLVPRLNAQNNTGLQINEIMCSNAYFTVDPDYHNYVDWIELYNSSKDTIDLNNYLMGDQRDEKPDWSFPNQWKIAPRSYLIVWADGVQAVGNSNKRRTEAAEEQAARIAPHSLFKLKSKSGFLALYNPDTILLDSMAYPKQFKDVSYGKEEGTENWAYYLNPTLGKKNGASKVNLEKFRKLEAPVIGLESGFYMEAQQVEIDGPKKQTFYSLDGSIPTENSFLYKKSIPIDSTTILRSRVIDGKNRPSKIVTKTYFIDTLQNLPVFSIVADPSHLFDTITGFYVPRHLVDVRKDWMRPAQITYFNKEGGIEFDEGAAIRLYGRTAIRMAQKSLAVLFKDKYGKSQLNYQLFADKELDVFDSFLLRSSSDDWELTMFNDAFVQHLIKDYCDVTIMHYQPSLVFINGEYYGIHNIREKLDNAFLRNNFDVKKGEVDFMKNYYYKMAGRRKDFNALRRFALKQDFTQPEIIDSVYNWIDVENFTDFNVVELYTSNKSWRHNNKMWRKRSEEGKWRWMLYDLDRTFQNHNYKLLPELDRKNELLVAMLQNEGYKNYFVQRFAAHINITFEQERFIALQDSFKLLIEPDIPRHVALWKDKQGIHSVKGWYQYLEEKALFNQQRRDTIRIELTKYLNLDGWTDLDIEIENPEKGQITINGIPLKKSALHTYAKNMPIKLEAIPNPGQRFAGWSGILNSKETQIEVTIKEAASIKAVFK